MRPADLSDLWWRTAVIYCLDIETFQDSDGDGVGDIDGLANRIGHLADLGVTCLWLMPFQPTRDLDDGYDITDFYGVDRRLGDLGRFIELMRVAHDRGIRVIIDLVVNHTSDRHPWFVDARRSRSSRYRDYYVWRDRPPRRSQPTVFPGEEDGVWEKDERTGQYYLHSFYRHQPDLNLANPAVRAEIARIVGFWSEVGVDGFRIDAVPFLIEPPGAADASDPHAFLRELRRFIGRRRGDAALLGEVGLPHSEQMEYFGSSGTELDLQFDFETCAAMFLSFARHEATPLAEVLSARPATDARQGWATFLRNHDELSIEMLDDDAREEVFAAFGPEEAQRVYGRGIVRRLAPMLHGDPRRLRLAYSLLFSLPGAPVLFYGEEIGMGELPGAAAREAVRTPMQWRREPLGGFSGARPSRSVRPVPQGGYGPQHVNVEEQHGDPDSLLSFISTLAARYRASPEIAWGAFSVIEQGDPLLLVHQARTGDAAFLAVHNFGDEPRSLHLPAGVIGEGPWRDLLLPGPPLGTEEDPGLTVELDGYGFRWFRHGPEGG